MSKTTRWQYSGIVTKSGGNGYGVDADDGYAEGRDVAMAPHIGQRVTVTVTVKPERKARGWRWVRADGTSWLLAPGDTLSDNGATATVELVGDVWKWRVWSTGGDECPYEALQDSDDPSYDNDCVAGGLVREEEGGRVAAKRIAKSVAASLFGSDLGNRGTR